MPESSAGYSAKQRTSKRCVYQHLAAGNGSFMSQPVRGLLNFSPSIPRSLAGAVTLLVCSALLAVGCSGGGTDAAVADVSSDSGPLAWLPKETWAVGTVAVDPKQLDVALKTLERLPAWSLAKSFLPASDGAGLRAAMLKQIG
ncbi:MAG: hypothetical protein ABI200_01005 [Gaiellales bacterium]